MNRIYCLGDGYAHGHIWPEWPQLLGCLFPTHEIICITGIGAGNEFLISNLLEHDISDCTVIFQWAQADRFDKLIEDRSWAKHIDNDKVYNDNIVDNWWLSSASTNQHVETYHSFFVQLEQANLRLKVQKQLIESYLRDKGCTYVCTSTEEQAKFAKHSRFAKVRQQEVQPSPIVHLNFLTEIILPQLNIVPEEKILNYITTAVENTTWIAYDPDREEILNGIAKHIDSN